MVTPIVPTLYDSKAVKILLKTYWGSKGWRAPIITPSDLDYAMGKGLMFVPALLPHDATLHRLQDICDSLSPPRLGDAFLASLGSRELALRSALGSFAAARFRPVHHYTPSGALGFCRECGLHPVPTDSLKEDINVLNFERFKWGGVRHSHAAYQVFDLEQFRQLPACRPTAEDVAIFQRILVAVRSLPPRSKVGNLEKALSKVLPSSKNERQQLIEILCLCGVLSYPGYRHRFDDSEPPKGRRSGTSDWAFPAMHWRAEDGYSLEALEEYFPAYVSQLAAAGQ